MAITPVCIRYCTIYFKGKKRGNHTAKCWVGLGDLLQQEPPLRRGSDLAPHDPCDRSPPHFQGLVATNISDGEIPRAPNCQHWCQTDRLEPRSPTY